MDKTSETGSSVLKSLDPMTNGHTRQLAVKTLTLANRY